MSTHAKINLKNMLKAGQISLYESIDNMVTWEIYHNDGSLYCICYTIVDVSAVVLYLLDEGELLPITVLKVIMEI